MSRRGGFFGSLATGLAGGLTQSTKDIGRRLIESQRYADAQKRYQEREATRQAERREMMDIQRAMRDAQEQKYLFDRAASMIPQSQRARAFAETGGNLAGATPEQLRGYADAARQQQLDDYNRELEGRKQLLRMQLAARNRGRGRGSAGVERQLAVGDRNALELPIKELFKTSKYVNKQIEGLQKQVSDGTLEPKQADDMREKLTIQLNKLRDRQSAAPGALSALGEAITRRRSGQQLNPANVINALERYIYASTGQGATEESIRFLGSQFGLLSPNAQLTPGVSGLGVLNLRSNQQ